MITQQIENYTHEKCPGDISRNQIDYIMFNEWFRNCIKQAKSYPRADRNSDLNPVVVKFNMKSKRTNAIKGSEQLELNLLIEETYKYKYNVEVQNIYERLWIEETEQQPDNGSFNNQCDKKWTTVNKRGGGVGLFVSNANKFTPINPRSLSSFECISGKPECGRACLNTLNIYRPPGPASSFFSELQDR